MMRRPLAISVLSWVDGGELDEAKVNPCPEDLLDMVASKDGSKLVSLLPQPPRHDVHVPVLEGPLYEGLLAVKQQHIAQISTHLADFPPYGNPQEFSQGLPGPQRRQRLLPVLNADLEDLLDRLCRLPVSCCQARGRGSPELLASPLPLPLPLGEEKRKGCRLCSWPRDDCR